MLLINRSRRVSSMALAFALITAGVGTALAQSRTGDAVMVPPEPKLVWEGKLRAVPPPPSGLGMRPPAIAIAPLAAAIVPPPAKPGTTIQRQNGTWIEGPGYDITYGADYDTCAKRCLGTTRCVMIEYYTPEKKCNLYDTIRPQKAGGSSFVGIRK